VAGSAALAAVVALAVGGWWWVVNLVRYGTVQPSGTAPLPAIDTDPDLLDFTWSFLSRVTASTWGSFGWLEVQVPVALQLAGLTAVLGGLALFLARRPEQPWARAAGAAAVAGFVLQTAVVYQQSLKNYLRGGYLAGLQGRYLFAFVAVLAAVVAVGLARALPAAARRRAPLLALAVVVVAQAVGVLAALDGFWWPDGEGLRRALAIQSAWAPFPRWTTLLAALVGAAALVLLVRAALSREQEPAPRPVPVA
jgi:small subunit ribosomal protein S36